MNTPTRPEQIHAMHLAEIDVSEPIEAVCLPPGLDALALLVRRKGRPVGFIFKHDVADGGVPAAELRRWIAAEIGSKLVSEAIREELWAPAPLARPPSLTVAICTHNRVATLSRCLDSLNPLRTRHGFEVLVVDNAPPDDATRDLVSGHPGVRYAVERRTGLDFARNRAWQEASGDWVAYIDDDVVVDPHWFDGLTEVWRDHPEAAAITGLVMPMKMDTRARVLFELRSGFRRGFDRIRFGQELAGNRFYPCGAGIFGAGCNMAFRRDLLARLGGFDEALDTGAPLPGGGDLDMFYRVVRSGHTLIYEPTALVFHEHRETENGLRRQYRSWGLGFMAFVQKSRASDPAQNRRFLRLICWWFADLGKQWIRAVRGRHVLPPDMIRAELWGGVVGLCGEYSRSLRRIDRIKKETP